MRNYEELKKCLLDDTNAIFLEYEFLNSSSFVNNASFWREAGNLSAVPSKFEEAWPFLGSLQCVRMVDCLSTLLDSGAV